MRSRRTSRAADLPLELGRDGEQEVVRAAARYELDADR
jgi:hypothetical protein